VIILSEQPSHSKTGMPKVLDVKVQVIGALFRAPIGNFELHLPELYPSRLFVKLAPSLETETAAVFRLRPRPCDIQLLEVQICALSTQSTCVSLYTKQRVLGTLSLGNLNQDELTRPHQVEPLTMDILQMRIAGGRDGSSHSAQWRNHHSAG